MLGSQGQNGPAKDVEPQSQSAGVTDEPKPNGDSSTPGKPEAIEPPTAEDSKGPKTGEKRHIDGSDDAATGIANGAESGESSEKKQKTEQPSEAESRPVESSATEGKPSTSNDEDKKKPGRPKKSKEASKKVNPPSTDGIGSRTRSRTKAT